MLTLIVPTFNPHPREGESASRYPTVNALGNDSFRGGRKTDEYRYLFAAVREAARAEIERTGWVTADYYVDVHWTRIVTTRRSMDCLNGAKCELDAMEPDTGFAGVYENDRLVIPHPEPPQYDPTPGALDRIRIVVERRWYPIIMPPDAPRAVRKTRAKAVAVAEQSRSVGAAQRSKHTSSPAVQRIRSLSEIQSGETVSFAERDAILKRENEKSAQPARAARRGVR